MQSILLSTLLFLPGQPSLQIQPGAVTLSGPQATQRLLVHRLEKGGVVADVTERAEFFSSNPKVAIVDEGVVKAVGDGEASISANHDDMSATIKIKVEKTRAPATISFVNQVIPLFTKLGCNSGACHGALAGKGGMKLSLRGYDPVADHFVLTRQASARRVNRQEPARSLMLMKPTLALPHGGGLKLEVKSPEFQVLADWIATGAPSARRRAIRARNASKSSRRAREARSRRTRCRCWCERWYSDGHTEDVTRWTKFNSTEDLVAGVDDAGMVKVAGHGEAAITAIFAGQVVARASRRRFRARSIGKPSPPRRGTISSMARC